MPRSMSSFRMMSAPVPVVANVARDIAHSAMADTVRRSAVQLLVLFEIAMTIPGPGKLYKFWPRFTIFSMDRGGRGGRMRALVAGVLIAAEAVMMAPVAGAQPVDERRR